MRIQDTITQNKYLDILTAFFHYYYYERVITREDNLYLDMRDLRVMFIFQEQNSYMYVLRYLGSRESKVTQVSLFYLK